MADEEIRRLLNLKSEGLNLDYKAGFEWGKANHDKKYELIRDLIALANTKDGGRVVFGVRDHLQRVSGVSLLGCASSPLLRRTSSETPR